VFAVAAFTTTLHASGLPAPMPEFLNQEQVAKWQADRIAAAESKKTAAREQAAIQFYTGRPFDTSSASYLFKFRSYDPGLLRWTSNDPSGFPDGTNNSNYSPVPIMQFDVAGLYVYSASSQIDPISRIWTSQNPITAYAVQPKPFVTQQLQLGPPQAQGGNHCYTVSITTGLEYTARSLVHLPQIGSSANGGIVTSQFRSDMSTHENWHVQLYIAFLNTVVAPLEQWSASYVSNTFETAAQATAAANADMAAAASNLTTFWTALRNQQGLHPNPASWVNGSNEWEALSPNWGANALATVNAFSPSFTMTPGNCE